MYEITFSGDLTKEQFQTKTYEEAVYLVKEKVGLLGNCLRTVDRNFIYYKDTQIAHIGLKYNVYVLEIMPSTSNANIAFSFNTDGVSLHNPFGREYEVKWNSKHQRVAVHFLLYDYADGINEVIHTEYHLVGQFRENGTIKILKDDMDILRSDIMFKINEDGDSIVKGDHYFDLHHDKTITITNNSPHRHNKCSVSILREALDYFESLYILD